MRKSRTASVSRSQTKNMAAVLIAALVITGLFGAAAQSYSYVISENANAGRFLTGAAIVGLPAIAVWNQTSNHVLYARALDSAGTVWPSSPVIVDRSTFLKSFMSMATINGLPAVCFTSRTANLSVKRLMFAAASDLAGNSFATSTPVLVVSGVNTQYNSLNEVNGRPAIAYYDPVTMDLRFIRAAGPSSIVSLSLCDAACCYVLLFCVNLCYAAFPVRWCLLLTLCGIA